MLNLPFLYYFLPTVFRLRLAARLGVALRRLRPLAEDQKEDFGVVQAATLTLLALIIGFSFSMATSRYDLRKNYEEAEAKCDRYGVGSGRSFSGTRWGKGRAQLRRYTDLRIAFYRNRDAGELQQINANTAQLQNDMWNSVQGLALQQLTAVMALAVSGME